jgi:8-oxo-dGTP pyrophosphatase MutT (NUDIX family)
MASEEKRTVQPRHAATVILVRDSARGPEVFMMERHVKSDFVGGAYVFPGGRVDPADHFPETLCAEQTDASASRILGIPRGGMAFFVAAIRECFEEAGILLAYDGAGEVLDFRNPEAESHYGSLRSRLNAGEISLEEMAREEGFRLATDRMHYWAHWITPEASPIRYDTRFFLAKAPHNQTAAHDNWELTNSAWVTPREALAKADREEWTIIFPTRRNLMLLVDFTSADEMVAAARSRSDFPTMQPRIRRLPGGIQVVLPGDEGYDEAATDSSAPEAETPPPSPDAGSET